MAALQVGRDSPVPGEAIGVVTTDTIVACVGPTGNVVGAVGY